MNKLQMQLYRTASPEPPPQRPRRRRRTLRQELAEWQETIARLSPAARLERANRELLEQRRLD